MVRALHDGVLCVVTGTVRDVRPYMSRPAWSLIPTRLGSGTQIRLLEELAHAKAVVSTSIGVEGIDVRPGVNLEVDRLLSSRVNDMHASSPP
jgi:hypothetical protein